MMRVYFHPKMDFKNVKFSMLLICCVFVSLASKFCYAQAPDDEKLHESQIPPPSDQPSPEEIKAQLAKLFKQADGDNNDLLSIEEVKKWVDNVHKEIIEENVDRQWVYYEPHLQEVHNWQDYKPKQMEVLTWDNYRNKTYPDYLLNDPETPEEQRTSWANMVLRAERRWALADSNNDSILVKEEFQDFIHPEESTNENVRGVLVQESLEDMDRDGNDIITMNEYMDHLLSATPEQERQHPEWIEVQKSHFSTLLDKDKNGGLDREELSNWLTPSLDRHLDEAERLVSSADADKDQQLSVEEMIDNFNNFFTLIPPKFWAKFYSDNQLYGSDQKHDEL